MYIFCLRVCGRKKEFHFASKAEGKTGLRVFHLQVKVPEERDVLEILRGILKAAGTLKGDTVHVSLRPAWSNPSQVFPVARDH